MTETATHPQNGGVPAIALRNVSRTFRVSGGLFGKTRTLRAVRDLSLSLEPGETLGLVGESGCGKSTVVKMMLGLLKPDSGTVEIGGRSLAAIARRELVRRVQPVFQDPYASLNPTRTVRGLVEQPLALHGIGGDRRARVDAMLDAVGLPSRLAEAYPGELSGGQRQRVAIARALILEPQILICDEPTSALDVSVQAQVLNLLMRLRREMGLTMVFVSHDLAVVEHLADRVAVMYLGEAAETADIDTLFTTPRHPYSRALLASTLAPEPGRGLPHPELGSAPADAFADHPGCAFAPRCPRAETRCKREPPALRVVGGAMVRCHFAERFGQPAAAAEPRAT
ncbi:MAG: ATP-binding cassette domain-containing protein [Acuticoccus sp.]